LLGSVAIVLHAHLPWVRHPEHARPLEERWLHEALWESYLPLLDVLDRLAADGVEAPLAISVSPTLAAMLADPLLRARFVEHLDRLSRLAQREAARVEADPALRVVVAHYRDRLEAAHATWERIGGDVLGALVRHEERGGVELLTTGVTHGYLPSLRAPSVRAQLRLGLAAFAALGGHAPRGFWLPECAYDPSFGEDLGKAGIRYTILDAHGLELATPRPPHGTSAPVLGPGGVAFFARDPDASHEVWSREHGYPGDPCYRDFYRDIGFDLPEEALAGEVGPYGARVATGLKYHRITGPGPDKAPWDPAAAEAMARAHAAHFVEARAERLATLRGPRPAPILVAPYDAELFGHWWFEGPIFLEHVLRALDRSRRESRIEAITPGGYLARGPSLALASPAASSWGEGGFGEAWVGRSVDPSRTNGLAPAHLLRHVHHAERTVHALCASRLRITGVAARALEQAVRELCLLEASDWGFMIRRGEMAAYAEVRVRAHAGRVDRLCRLAAAPWIGPEQERWIEAACARTPFLTMLPGERLRSAFDPWELA
jgi:1,4-alpha-glucan branching enzyme